MLVMLLRLSLAQPCLLLTWINGVEKVARLLTACSVASAEEE